MAGSEKNQVEIMANDAEPKLVTWQELQEATNKDEVLVKLREEIQRGMADSTAEGVPQIQTWFDGNGWCGDIQAEACGPCVLVSRGCQV